MGGPGFERILGAMELWLRDRPERDSLGPLPDDVSVHLIPRTGPAPTGIREAEFLVPPFGRTEVLELISEMPSLRVVQAISAGVEWLLPSVPRGVVVASARGIRDATVAEWVVGVILAANKGLDYYWREQIAGRWSPAVPMELRGARVLIVGYGSIGVAVEARLAAFEVEVDRVARHARPGVAGVDRLRELLPHADIVILLVPGTAETTGLFDAEMLRCLKPHALLVNAARGPVVDTAALLAELKRGRIRAALDVTDPEPLPGTHPLWRAPNLTITPHIAGDSQAAERRVYRFIGEQVRRYVRGDPLLNVIGDSTNGVDCLR
jgi:phosphoglycerate dehydrogenase-like enzyme